MLINSVITGKIIKKILKTAVLAFVVLLTTLAALFTILRSPMFQELAGRIAAGYVSEKLGTEIHLAKFRINDLLNIEIKGLQVKDNHKNEIFRVDNLMVNTEYISLRDNILYFDRVRIDGGGFFLEWYPGDTLMNLDYILGLLTSDTAAPGTPAASWEIRCKDLSADNLAFSYHAGETDSTSGINFEDLEFSNIFIDIHDVIIFGDSVSAYVEHLAFNEKSGFELLNFSGDARVSGSGIRVKGTQISTGNSSLDLDIDFAYKGYDKLGWFLDSVDVNAEIRSSMVTLSDIGYFAPELKGMQDPVMISGLVHGPISDFSATNLVLSLGDFTEFEGEISMKGLPDFYSTFVDLKIDRLNTTPDDVSSFILPLTNYVKVLPPEVEMLGFTSVTGWYKGMPDDFTASLNVNTDVGSLILDGKMAEGIKDSVLIFSGSLKGSSINLGTVFSSEELGLVNLEFTYEGSGKSFTDLQIDVDGMIEDFEFRQYSYEEIYVDGIIDGSSFNGYIAVSDSLIALDVDGLVDFNGEFPVLDLAVKVDKAHLSQLHLADRSEDMNLSGQADIDMKGLDPDSFEGIIKVSNFSYLENGTTYLLKNLVLTRYRLSGTQDELSLRSDYIDGDIDGNFSVKNLVNHLMVFFLDKEPDPATRLELDSKPQNITFDFRLKDLTPVTSLFLPGLEISPGTNITGKFDSKKSILDIEGHVTKLSISGITADDLNFSGTTNSNDFQLELAISKIILGDSEDDTGIGIENMAASISSGNDSINYSMKWDNNIPYALNKGSVSGFFKLNTLEDFEAGLINAEATLNGNTWLVENDNLFKYDSTRITIKDFSISREGESLEIDGSLSDQPEDTLSVYFYKWSLQNFNPLLESISLELSGIINGRFGIFRNKDNTNLFAGLNISDFTLNDVFFGDAEVSTRWLESSKALALDLNIFSKGSQENPFKILGVNGMYYPFDDKRNFDFDVTVQNLNISILEPMLSSFSSHTDGFATGKLTFGGTTEKPLLLGRLKLQRAEMKIDYLNVTYSFSNEVVFTKDQIQFNELTVFDPNSNKAQLSGGIKHNYFKDMSLDLTIKPDKFMAMNLDRYQNEVFYGKAFATGTVRLHGPFENLSIDIDASTEKGTNVTIPINYSVDVSQNDFIVFTNIDDTLNGNDERDVKVVGVSLDIALDVNRNADIEIILPGNIGNIKASGDGDLRLGVDPNYYLTLNGSYKIHTGLFVFSFEELVSRRFEIREGSSISWTGDIYDAEVNIIARYRLRTSLEGLGISLMDPEAASEKVIVNTDIRMTGNLFNPELSFGITFPNMQEQTKQAIYAVLDTNDAGLMNQQAISLLVLGSFSSTGTSSVSNPVNPAAIVSNTLSNMLSQISNDFNVGINYVPGDQVSSEQLEVALSTQLLDDRLVIDGNFDVSGSSASSQQTSSIVGDINVEYKLTPDGRFRVKAFNRSNDLTLFNDYAPYTQGVGIFYRKSFNNLEELFTKYGKAAKQKRNK